MTGFNHWEAQKALYELLSADAPLTALVEGIYDQVPARTPFPYVTISDIASRDWSSKTTQGLRLSATIHAYSRKPGTKEINAILKRLYALLHNAALAVEGQACVLCQVESSAAIKDADGLTLHGIIRLVILTQAV